MFPCIINGFTQPMVIKHFFLHLRDNVGCQLLKRTVKTGAALVENAGRINNESQMGGGTKERQLQGETILVDRTDGFPIPANVRRLPPVSAKQAGEQDGHAETGAKNKSKQESNSNFTPTHAERAQCGNGDICSVPVAVCLADGPR